MLRKKRVLIVGAGAAGSAAAYSLGRHRNKFHVEVWEQRKTPGGAASSCTVNGDVRINDGVQGGTPAHRNVINFLHEFGFETHAYEMLISFGKGSKAWTNHSKSELTDNYRREIKKFGEVLRTVYRYDVFFIFIPISKVLNWYKFSSNFCYDMVYPLTALFFGSGNQTKNISSALVARVFHDESLKVFNYDYRRMLSQAPEVFAFPNLEDVYKTILEESGVKLFVNRKVTNIRRSGRHAYVTDVYNHEYTFDEVIFACDAEAVLNILDEPTFIENRALGNVRYHTDVIVTHEDDHYMRTFYDSRADKEQHFVRSDVADRSKIEVSTIVSLYQPLLEGSSRNIYQTTFQEDPARQLWNEDRIHDSRVLWKRCWRHFAQTWRHFAFTVPLMRFIQGQKHTWFCGSYTHIDNHETAVMSGLAVAHKLGAPYPFSHDKKAAKQFDRYMMIIHGQPRSLGANKDTIMSYLLVPLIYIFAGFAIVLMTFLRFFQ